MSARKSSKVPQFFCKTCNVGAPNEASFQSHLAGKRHTQNAKKLDTIEREARKSVFVANCMHLPVAELALADYFLKFGSVSKITVDKNRGTFAIVEFDDESSVPKVLEREEHEVAGIKLVVKPRETKLPSTKKPEVENHEIVHKQMQREVWNLLLNASDISGQFAAIQRNLSLNDEEKHVRGLLCRLLAVAFEEVFHSCKVEPFGSSVNGIGFHGCDVDLNLSFQSIDRENALQFLRQGSEQVDNKEDGEISDAEVLRVAASIIKNCVPDCCQVRAILSARRPVVKFRHKASDICCDLSVGNQLAIRNTEFINHICENVPNFTPLLQTVKLWMKHWNLAGSSKAASPLLNNYAVCMMVLFYLYKTGALYTIDELRAKDDDLKPCVIEKWDCSFSKSNPRKESVSLSIPDIFSGFFKFYAKFEFSKHVMCLKSGELQDVKSCTLTKDDVSYPFKIGPLNIRDPFELNHNIAGNVGKKHMIVFTKCIRNAALACDMKIYRNPPNLRAAAASSSTREAWGVLSLFVDHHVKRTPTSPKQKTVVDEIVRFDISETSPSQKHSLPGLVVTILTDVFMIDVVPGSKNEQIQFDGVGPEKPIATEDTSEMSTPSRKRRIEDDNPSPKRARLQISSPEAAELNEKATSSNGSTLDDLPLDFKCRVTHRVWEGRRKMRRRLVKPAVRDVIDLERQISRLLVSESQSADGSINGTPDISTLFATTLRVTAEAGNQLVLSFRYDTTSGSRGNRDTEQDFKNMVHHLSLSLPGIVKKCLRNTAGGTGNADGSVGCG